MLLIKEEIVVAARWVLLLTCLSILSACRSVPIAPIYVEKVKLEYSNPQPDPQADPACTCDQSRAAYLHNYDLDNDRHAEIIVTVKLDNQPPAPFSRGVFVPRGAGESGKPPIFLGCTINKNGNPGVCSQLNTYRKAGESTLRQSANLPGSTLTDEVWFMNNAQTCNELCKHSGSCYQLGVQAAPLAVPFLALLDAAHNSSTITKSDILKKYNLQPSDDKCNRTDITFLNEKVLNKGDGCEIRVSDYEGSPSLADNVMVYMPPDVIGSPQNPHKVLPQHEIRASDQIIKFEDSSNAPAFGFKEDIIDNRYPLTGLYGGAVRSASRLDDFLILANTNGCMRIKLK